MTISFTGTVSKAWSGMRPEARRQASGQAALHLLLAMLAFRSVLKRPSGRVRGPKLIWMALIPMSWSRMGKDSARVLPLGPLAYFVLGRRS